MYLIFDKKELEEKKILEVSLIYYIEPPKEFTYIEIKEEDFPKDKDGYSKKVFYNKENNEVYAEYEEVINEENPLKKEIEQLKTANVNLAESIAQIYETVLDIPKEI
ncbi:hypothetical protein [Peptostreptococcus faecalis]|uniref:hypothetical protein n=1 Tax=Peptostreptococcus faecalis TaxID=2045015 RepID=UPI000C7DCDA5|nr:hypothetical protein [Peptostreptococcus faecalis]